MPLKRTLVLVFALLGSLLTAGCKSKSSSSSSSSKTRPEDEAHRNLAKIATAAKTYYETPQKVVGLPPGKTVPKMFPGTTRLTPRGSCTGGKDSPFCAKSSWRDPTWKALGFEIKGKHRYQYQLISSGDSDQATFIARAVRRQGKDKQGYEVIDRSGKVGPQGKVVLSDKATFRRVATRSALLRPERQGRSFTRCIRAAYSTMRSETYRERCTRLFSGPCTTDPGFRSRHKGLCRLFRKERKKLGEPCRNNADCQARLTCDTDAQKCAWAFKCEDFSKKIQQCLQEVYVMMRPKQRDKLLRMKPASRKRFLSAISRILQRGLCAQARKGIPYKPGLALRKITPQTTCAEFAKVLKTALKTK